VHRVPHLPHRLQEHLDRRKGAEYMWWNNVETKPGTGYPTKWENQDIQYGGWEEATWCSSVSLNGAGKSRA
jgi:nitrate reductase beta subunit